MHTPIIIISILNICIYFYYYLFIIEEIKDLFFTAIVNILTETRFNMA